MIGLKGVGVPHIKGGDNKSVPCGLPAAVLGVQVVGLGRHVPLHQEQQDQAGQAEHQGGHCENQGKKDLLQPHGGNVRRPCGKTPGRVFGKQRLYHGGVGRG